ncbi:alpha/beta fold hydrolase [Kibdelosporangium lantanae]
MAAERDRDGRRPIVPVAAGRGSAALFASWPAAAPPAVVPCPIELPGRGRRLTEPPSHDLTALVAAMDAACAPRDGKPWVLFGHSMGALLAAAWAARACRAGRGPNLLYLSAAAPPWLLSVAEPLALLDESELWRYMTDLGGVPAQVRTAAGARLFAPIMRADVLAAATYRPPAPEPVGCPVVVVTGVDDPVFPGGLAAAWREVSSGGFTLCRVPGGHFYRTGLDDLIPLVFDDLTARLPAFGGAR